MTEPQPDQPYQLGIALAETPQGQRLAIVAASGPLNLTLLLTATEAKQLATQMADAAASMSTTGLIAANGAMASSQVSGMVQNGQSPSK
jgi:hypothetical protein